MSNGGYCQNAAAMSRKRVDFDEVLTQTYEEERTTSAYMGGAAKSSASSSTTAYVLRNDKMVCATLTYRGTDPDDETADENADSLAPCQAEDNAGTNSEDETYATGQTGKYRNLSWVDEKHTKCSTVDICVHGKLS